MKNTENQCQTSDVPAEDDVVQGLLTKAIEHLSNHYLPMDGAIPKRFHTSQWHSCLEGIADNGKPDIRLKAYAMARAIKQLRNRK